MVDDHGHGIGRHRDYSLSIFKLQFLYLHYTRQSRSRTMKRLDRVLVAVRSIARDESALEELGSIDLESLNFIQKVVNKRRDSFLQGFAFNRHHFFLSWAIRWRGKNEKIFYLSFCNPIRVPICSLLSVLVSNTPTDIRIHRHFASECGYARCMNACYGEDCGP